MSKPRQLHVIGKKSEVADRTLNERKYCAIDDYYYSEMFTCPICFGADREQERIIKLLKDKLGFDDEIGIMDFSHNQVKPDDLIALIKGEKK